MKKPIVGKLIAFTQSKDKSFDLLIEYQELASVLHGMKAQGAKLEGCFFLDNSINMKVTPPNLLDQPFRVVYTPMNYQEYRKAEFEEMKREIDKWFGLNLNKPFITKKNYPVGLGKSVISTHSTNEPKIGIHPIKIVDDIEKMSDDWLSKFTIEDIDNQAWLNYSGIDEAIKKEIHDSVSLPTPAINLTERAEEMRKQQKESPLKSNWRTCESANQRAIRLFQQRNKRD